MAVPQLTTVAQDYLKSIWAAREWSDLPVTTKALAERLAVSPSTVSETIRRLADQGLVTHRRYGTIELTEAGRAVAVEQVRRHRLMETFLVRELGYSWDEVHDDAEILEHAASATLIERVDAKLGRPLRDPHGDPIPRADGTLPTMDALPLAELESGRRAVVARISDADSQTLRYLAGLGLTLDQAICVVEHRDYAGTIALTLGEDAEPLELGAKAAAAVWVTLPDAAS